MRVLERALRVSTRAYKSKEKSRMSIDTLWQWPVYYLGTGTLYVGGIVVRVLVYKIVGGKR